MSAATHNGGGAPASPRLELADWIGLSMFLAPVAIAAVDWLMGAL